ncbi:MAG: class I SAM-dependent methyltransferase [Alphaproteobacteria bacterium]|nr:class I SAM-dependent methyltransferase [Alphaproteobacteria bacterium]
MDPLRDLYSAKPAGYFANARDREVVPLLAGPVGRALELGCGEGATLARLKEQGLVGWAAGIEIQAEAADRARDRLDQVICGNVETLDDRVLPRDLDLILCLDVLEHLVDPWAVVRRLAGRLRPGGAIVACLPNLRHVGTLLPLVLNGRFDYAESGTLDRGHLRFFTRSSARDLFEQAGLAIVRIEAPVSGKSALLDTLTLGLARDLCAYRYMIRAEVR